MIMYAINLNQIFYFSMNSFIFFLLSEILVEAIYLSVEPPYMRSFGEFPPSILGITMVGGQIAR